MTLLETLALPEYQFLKTDERLNGKIAFLCYGGSYAYGLNGPNSDIDIRGAFLPSREEILSPNFTKVNEQILDNNTDTQIYSTNKLLQLLSNCNPNTIELLGCLPEHYAYISEAGQLILDNKDLFLTKRCYHSFLGYATAQLTRLQNALINRKSNLEKLLNIVFTVKRIYPRLESKYPTFHRDDLILYVVDDKDDSIRLRETDHLFNRPFLEKEELSQLLKNDNFENCHLALDINMKNISITDLKGVVSEVNSAINSFDSIGHRNNKKSHAAEDKHASHLLRIIRSSESILKDHKIMTYCGDYIEELKDIKQGKYRLPDGTYDRAFFTMIDEAFEEIEKIYQKSDLPNDVDKEKLIKLQNELSLMALSQ